MKKNYSIGEIARYCGVTTRTLRYYDDMGLVKPIRVDPDTGYRYYSDEIVDRLILINTLKDMGLSLKEVQAELADIDARKYLGVLEKRKAALEHQLERLKGELRMVSQLESDLDKALSSPMGVCFTAMRPSHIGSFISFVPGRDTGRLTVRTKIKELEEKWGFHFVSSTAYRVISEENLRQRKYDYTGFFICDDRVQYAEQDMVILPEQLCAACYCPKVKEDSVPYWEKMLEYIDESGYEMCGNGMKKIILEKGISMDREEYISLLTIPIRKAEP